jgi:D-lactate dehydrogenase
MEITKPQALVTEINQDEGQYLTQHLEDILSVRTTGSTLVNLERGSLAEVEVLIPFIHSKVGRAEMEAMPRLRLIATRSTGYDHIDVAAAHEKGIAVANVPNYGENTVAEHTFGLILVLSRKIHQAYIRTQRGDYTREGLRGFDLYGKTLGVVGAGAIGLHVIRIAKGFGMNVLAYDVMQNRLLAEVLGFRYVSLDELLSQSDIVTLHAPALPSTYHLINRETLSKMKRGALLINTARGSLVDTGALAWALDTGMLAGVGLDTLEGEEVLQHEDELLQQSGTEEKLRLLVRSHILQRRSDVVITPHIGFNSEEALRRILDITIENVRTFLSGHPRNLVNMK